MLYRKIAEICKEKNIAISALESACGLGHGTIRGWVTSSPRVDSLQKVAKYLDLSIDKLLEQDRSSND